MDRNSPQFKKLQKQWYGKLKKKGFNDIEHPTKDYLSRYDDQYFKKAWSPLSFEMNQRYFELARQIAHEYPFSTAKERHIWDLHTEGATLMAIAKKMKTTEWAVRLVVEKVSKCIKVG